MRETVVINRFLISTIILIGLFCLGATLTAKEVIVSIPMPELQSQMGYTDRYEIARSLLVQGYRILYYNEACLIAVMDDSEGMKLSSARYLSIYPPENDLYIVNMSKMFDKGLLSESGEVLLEMGSSMLLQSALEEIELQNRLKTQFTKLSLEPMRFPVKTLLPAYSKEYRTDIAQLVSHVSADSVETRLYELQNFVTRHALADNRLQVAEWIRQKFASFGIADAELQAFDYNGTQQYNVVATIPGTDYPDEYIIVGGHHDSRSTNINVYDFAPGADDNASGTVAALDMARVIQQYGYQPQVSIRFVTFACEELGLWGSKHYSQNALDNEQNIRLMINHDMIANNTATSERPVKIMRYDGALDYADYALQLTSQYTDLVPEFGPYNYGGSDQITFWQKGFNTLFFNEAEFSPVYHSPEDVVANLDPDYCAEVIKASLACTVFFADIPGSPDAPLATAAMHITNDSFTANWDPVDHADRYLLDVYTKDATEAAPDLFFSEYIEGGGHNQALEIYNGTGQDVDLNDYTVQIFFGASTSPSTTYYLELTGILADGEVVVICHPVADPALLALADFHSFVAVFDGDDQLALLKESTNSYVDIIGRIGEDPGTGWGTYPLTTLNRTLVRKNWVYSGVTDNPTSGFLTLESEWDSYLVNTFDYLGYHSTFLVCYLPGLLNLEVIGSNFWNVGALESEHTYYYTVWAANDYFTSDLSNEIIVHTLQEPSLPVEMASFSALVTVQNQVRLVWTVQSETGMQGYRILRSASEILNDAILISPLVPATNSAVTHSYVFTDGGLTESGTYYYWLQCLENNGCLAHHGPIFLHYDAITNNQGLDVPMITQLKAIYPNPFNPVAFIPFSLAEPVEVKIRIYNLRGQIVRDFDLGEMEPGFHHVTWDGNDPRGKELASGLYQIQLTAGSQNFQRKAILLK